MKISAVILFWPFQLTVYSIPSIDLATLFDIYCIPGSLLLLQTIILVKFSWVGDK